MWVNINNETIQLVLDKTSCSSCQGSETVFKEKQYNFDVHSAKKRQFVVIPYNQSLNIDQLPVNIK